MEPLSRLAAFVLEQSTDVISIIGRDYHYRYANPAYEALTGLPVSKVIGAHVRDVMGAELFDQILRPRLEEALTGRPVNYQAWFDLAGKAPRCMDIQYNPLNEGNGSVDGVVVMARDITRWKRAEEAASHAEQRLRLALDAAGAGTWEAETGAHSAHWSDETFRILGYEPGSVAPSTEAWRRAVHPEDREWVHQKKLQALASGQDPRVEYRVVRPNGEIRWVLSMARGLNNLNGRPAAMTGIVLDITARKQDEEALLRAKREAENANIGKSNFLAAASHDLRQPFQAMRLFHQVLEMQCGESLRPVVDQLGRAMDSGEELLNSLLDISTLDAGRVEPKLEPVEVAPLLEEVAGDCAKIAEAAHLRLSVVACNATVQSDRVLLKRMIRNLLVNSIRYTRQGGILLGCRRRGGHVLIQVVDTGIGIPADRQEMIFQDFYQVDNPSRDKSRGLGLGLAIVSRLGRLLQHPVRVSSRVGHGSVFSVEVPQAPLPPG